MDLQKLKARAGEEFDEEFTVKECFCAYGITFKNGDPVGTHTEEDCPAKLISIKDAPVSSFKSFLFQKLEEAYKAGQAADTWNEELSLAREKEAKLMGYKQGVKDCIEEIPEDEKVKHYMKVVKLQLKKHFNLGE